MTTDKSKLEWALHYQAKNFSVIPLWANHGRAGKEPLISHKGQSPLTAEQIKHYWGQNPDLNIGIKTTNLFTVDFDVPPHHEADGMKSWAEHAELGPLLLPTLSFTTGTGGKQYVYFKPSKRQVKSRTNWLPGVDIRGDDNHYFVAPPSVNFETGRKYTWDNQNTIVTGSVDLVNLINTRQHYDQPQRQQAPFSAPSPTLGQGNRKRWTGALLDEIVAGAVAGERNAWLTHIAGKLYRVGADPETIYSLLHTINQAYVQPQLPEYEVSNIFNSAMKNFN